MSLLVGILFPLSSYGQFLIEHTFTWNKATIIRPSHYKPSNEWGAGRQTGFWLVYAPLRPTHIRIGAIIGRRETYFNRIYPKYNYETLTAKVTRNERFVTIAAMLDQRIKRFKNFEWTANGGIGGEIQAESSQLAQVQPGGAMPYSTTSNFYPVLKAVVLLRTGILYHPTRRLSVGLEASYNTHLGILFSKVDDKYAPQSIGLNIRGSYYIGKFKIPEAK